MDIKKTITSIFMVPTLQIPKNSLKDNGFINAYSTDIDKEHQYKDCICLLFKPPNLDKFREFLDLEHERTKNVIEDYDYEDGFVVVVYKLDDKFKEDFDLIRQGKYSKTSKKFQDVFPKAVKILINGKHRDEIALQVRIFKKTQDLIDFWEEKLDVKFEEDQEVWRGWDDQDEQLNLNKIKEYESTGIIE
jgi:hypothetical protein